MRVRQRAGCGSGTCGPAHRIDESDASADCAGAGRSIGTRHGVITWNASGPDLLGAAAVCGISVFNAETPRSRLLAMGYRTDASDTIQRL